MSSPPPASTYRLDELGWLQFERVCLLVLEVDGGLSDVAWLGHADVGRVGLLDGSVSLASAGIELAGPVTVLVVWTRAPGSLPARLRTLVDRVAALVSESEAWCADQLLLLTNLASPAVAAALREQPCMAGRTATVLGCEELGQSIDRHPGVRMAMPSVLGLRDLTALISASARARSSLEIESTQMLARVFWPTRAYERARGVLATHRFVVLTGPPEMGKTAIAQMLALGLMTDGWEAHECNSPEALWRVFDRARRQVFVADDAFGSTEYRPDAAERWAQALGRLLTMLDDDHWLIWTSRPAPLKAGLRRVQRERGSERFPAPGQVLVDAGDLDLAEKTLILFRHMKARGASRPARALVRLSALSIVEHPHFTPERIRRFVSDRIETLREPAMLRGGERIRTAIERELALPTEAMLRSFRALEAEHRELLIAMLDAPAGWIDERELAAAVRRHHPAGLSRSPTEVIDRLTDHFLRVTPLGVGWVHPSWRDLVIDELRQDPGTRARFLGSCEVHGILLALSSDGGVTGERALPLLVGDDDWDVLDDRLRTLLPQLEDRTVAAVLLALRDALERVHARQRVEAQALAGTLLRASARQWEERHQPLPVFLIDAWYQLSEWTEPAPGPPQLARTWAELHPGTPGTGGLELAELIRVDDWLALSQTLARLDPHALRGLGFFGPDQDLLADLVGAVRRSAEPDTLPLVESILGRIQDVAPRHFASAGLAGRSVRELGESGPDWWIPEDLPEPPSTEPVPSGRVEFTPDDVDRVLSDL